MIKFEEIDWDYVKILAKQNNDNLSFFDNAKEHTVWGATVIAENKKSGVVFIQKFNDNYFLEAYKDKTVRNPIKYSKIVFEKVINILTLEKICYIIYTAHRKNNRLDLFTLSVGFEFLQEVNGMNIFFRRINGA